MSFGLVSIPVKLYSTGVAAVGISFNMLHKKCHTRVKQQYVCPTDHEVVPREEMVKGYEFAKDRYVVFTDDELKALEELGSKAIEIAEFVPAGKVDPIQYDGGYYMGPDKGGERAFRLLCEAMRQTNQCAIARYSARGKQSLVLVRPLENALVLQYLHYAEEMRPIAEVPVGTAEVKPQELQLAMQFVSQLATDDFHPEKYEDSVRKRTLDLIQKKVEGEPIAVTPAEAPTGQIIDLMEALKASLGQRPPAAAPTTPAQVGASAPAPSPIAAQPTVERKPPKRSPRAPKTPDAATGDDASASRGK